MKKSLLLLLLLFNIVQYANAQWQKTNGPVCDFVYSIKSNDSYLFASSQIGIFRSGDGGDNWISVNNGLKDSFVFSLEILGNKVIAGTKKNGIFISSNNGNNWKEANNGLTAKRTVWTLMDDNESIYAGLDFGLFVTNDYGIIWGSLGLPMLDIVSIAKTGSFLIAGGHTVYISENNGITWNIKNNGLPNDDIADLAICDSIVFILTSNWGLYKSYDFGDNWEADATFNINTCKKILVKDSDIFVGTYFYGIYYSSDYGQSWKNISDGLAYKTIYSMEIIDDYLYAGTYQGGVWKRKLSEIVGVEYNKAVDEITVCPNPASEKIYLKIPLSSKTELNIIDMNGNVLIKNNYHDNKNIEVNIDKIPKGVYILKIISGNEVFIEKFLKQ
ncbi:MAG: T9SS type A sorting domain-containing protein [Bacteroidota bacterium]|nr:T9SS type A sorting domain-containing protein [Bacteroidota bacterium]